MKTRLPLIVVCLLAAGCRTDPRLATVFESMNAEKRWLEDRVYELEDEYEQQADQLESARRENTKLRKQLGGGGSGADDSAVKKRGAIFPRPSGGAKSPDGGELDAPMIELGTPGDPGEVPKKAPTPKKPASFEKPSGPEMNDAGGKPSELPLPAIDAEQASYVEPDDPRVTHIVLNPFLTGGHDFDHKAGDDGVAVIVEPRNADDQFVSQSGPVSIVVVDPAVDGEAGRIARWDFDSIEANKRMKTSGLGRGINLKLPWPNQPPEHAKLRIFVRYENLEGRQLEVFRDVNIAMPGQYSQRWTPRPLDTASGGGSATSSVLVGRNAPSSFEENADAKKDTAKSARRPTWQPNR